MDLWQFTPLHEAASKSRTEVRSNVPIIFSPSIIRLMSHHVGVGICARIGYTKKRSKQRKRSKESLSWWSLLPFQGLLFRECFYSALNQSLMIVQPEYEIEILTLSSYANDLLALGDATFLLKNPSSGWDWIFTNLMHRNFVCRNFLFTDEPSYYNTTITTTTSIRPMKYIDIWRVQNKYVTEVGEYFYFSCRNI